MDITYKDGSKGTATWELGRHGAYALVLRKGYPVAAEVVAGIKADHVSVDMLGMLGVADALHVLAGLGTR